MDAGAPAGAGGPAPQDAPAREDWQTEWFSVLPEVDELARRRKGVRDVVIMRASQLDAARLDNELTAMLREQFMRIFSLFQPRVVSALQPELTLVLEYLIFRFSVCLGKPTPGAALMNLRFRDERGAAPAGLSSQDAAGSNGRPAAAPLGGRTGVEGPGLSCWQRGLYGVGSVFLRYAWARADQIAAAQHWGDLPLGSRGRRAWAAMRSAETAFRAASLLNFLVFLRYGRYRSVLERLLRARLVYSRAAMARALSFEYLNRQLVWHELSELLLFLLPLVNVGRLKAAVMSRLPRLSPPIAPAELSAGAGPAQEAGSATAAAAAAAAEVGQPCAICGARDVLVPYAARPCGHRFCYYCLRGNTLADARFACPRCGARVEAMQRWLPHPG
ncbi:hypothetical protein WJX81_006604 [Elliptochloris bilobata]|uniref:RING-type E3 ubiquitin transferase (cysteine targeting) n=1 Tax=Elliptochloris bilobata TaxID=381761 RepID=A0AAW1SHL3_9CHLO